MIFNRKNFLIFALAPGANDYRNMSAVHVTHKHTEVTNGSYFVRVAVPPNGDAKVEIPKNRKHGPIRRKRIDVVISKESAQAVLKGIPGGGFGEEHKDYRDFTWIGRRTEDGNTEFVSSEYGITRSAVVENLEQKFPDIEPVIKHQKLRRKPRFEIGFTPEFMKKLCDFFIKAKVRNVRMSLFGPDKGIIMTDALEKTEKDRQSIFVILMPAQLPEPNRAEKEESQEEEKAEIESEIT